MYLVTYDTRLGALGVAPECADDDATRSTRAPTPDRAQTLEPRRQLATGARGPAHGQRRESTR